MDFNFIVESYTCEYDILESYYSVKKYLPIEFINFILDKYEIKTKYKGIENKKVEYNIEKAKFNSLYGMTVTNTIRDDVIFDNELGWQNIKLTNTEIELMLEKQKEKGFLNFAWGVWVTAYARYNLLSNVIKLDEYCIYCDTDSIKLKKGFDINVIINYNKSVIEKIENVANERNIDINKFMPKDKKRNKKNYRNI